MKTTKRDLSAAQQTWRGRNDLICFSAAMLFMGAFFTFFPNVTAQRFCDFGGILLCALGVLRIVSYFVSSGMALFGSFQLVQGVSLIAFGIFFFVKAALVAQLLTILCGMALVVDCVLKWQYALDLFRVRSVRFAKWLLAGGVLSLAAGILVLCDVMVPPTSMIVMGISLIYAAVTDLVLTVGIGRWYRHVQTPAEDHAQAYEQKEN